MRERLVILRRRLPALADSFGQADLGLYAASGVYYLFFSLGPLVVLVLGLFPYLPFSREQLQSALLDLFGYAPAPLRELIENLVSGVYAGSSAALGIGLVTELWSAGRFLSLVMRGVGHIYDGRLYGSFLFRRLLGALYTAALLALVLGNLALLFIGEKLVPVARLWSAVVHLRGVLFFAIVTVINALLFSTVPHRKLRFAAQLPGAAFSAAAWLLFSRIYSWAVDRFGFYSVYGGLAIVIISLFWMFCSLYLLFLGAWLNTVWEETTP